MRLRHKLLLTSFLILPLLAGFFGVFNLQKASAVSAGDWRPGRIIDDVVFFNKDSMSVAQIQAFLDAKVPVCDRWRASSNPSYQPPYTCLKEYQENTSTGESNYGRFNPDGTPLQITGGKSAAQIIWEEAQNYNINPQSLIVMLQKEQSLVTDDWPWLIQYQKAMGQSCPDTAPCDPAFAGFYNQVSGAAWQLRHYINHPEWFNYRTGVTRNVLFNPNAECGGTSVYVENSATAALYNYTPYQPNTAALNNLYGTGDGCSSYGNRNFWRLFNDWFGSTLGDPFRAKFRKITPATTVTQDKRGVISIDFENAGTQFWKDDLSALPYYPRTRLVGTWPINRGSIFVDSSWLSPSRPVSVFTKVFESDGITLSSDQHTVWPGQVARFQFELKFPDNAIPGIYKEHFELVQDGAAAWWVPGGYAWQAVEIPPPFRAQFKAISPSTSVSPTAPEGSLWVDFKNTGSQFWKDDLSALPYYPRTRLVGTWPINRRSVFADTTWLSPSRPVSVFTKVFESDGITLSSDQHTVWPGQVARFQFKTKYPGSTISSGVYKEHFELVQDGAAAWWVPGGYAWQAVEVSH